MSDNAIYTVCVTIVVVFGLVAATTILLLYPGDRELLIGNIITGSVSLMTWLRVNKIVGDNKHCNDAVTRQVQVVVDKADSMVKP